MGSPACSTGRKSALLSSKCNCSVCEWLKTSRSFSQCRSKHFCINSFRLFWKPLFLPPHVGVRTEMDGITAGRNPTHPGAKSRGWHSSLICHTPLPQQWGNPPVYTFPKPTAVASATGISTTDIQALAWKVFGSSGKLRVGLSKSRHSPRGNQSGNQVGHAAEGGDSHGRIKVELEDNGSPSEAHISLQHPTAGAGKSSGSELTAFSNTWFFPLNYPQDTTKATD